MGAVARGRTDDGGLRRLIRLAVAILTEDDEVARSGGSALGGRDDVVNLEMLVGAAEKAGAVAGQDLLTHTCGSGLVPGTVRRGSNSVLLAPRPLRDSAATYGAETLRHYRYPRTRAGGGSGAVIAS